MKRSVFTLLLITLFVLLTAIPVFGDVPQFIKYQGRLTDTNGDPLNGSYSLEFRVFNMLTGGSQIWSETHGTVNIVDGVYHVLLGSNTALPEDLFTVSDRRYLEIAVAGQTLSPRTRFTSVSYALESMHSDSADVAATAVSAAPTGTAGGDLAGSYPNPTVDGLRGRSVATTAPNTNEVLKWNGSAWAPATDQTGGGSVWQTSGSDIYFNTGDVGIGNTSPTTALDVTGTITATSFSGSGASLTALNANNITTGTLTSARFGGTYSNFLNFSNASNTISGTFTGNGAAITALNADNISTGTVNSSRLPTTLLPNRVIASDYITADGGMHVGSSTDPGPDNLIVDGSVGIGTSALPAPLHVKGVADNNIRLTEDDSGLEYFDIRVDNGGNLDFINEDGVVGLTIEDITGHVGIGSDPGWPLSITTGTNMARSVYIDHDGHPTASNYGIYVEADNSGSGSLYGGRFSANNSYTSSSYTYGLYARAEKNTGSYRSYGVYGIASGDASGDKIGVYGISSGDNGDNYGLYGYASGSTTNDKIGVYGYAYSGQSDVKWGVYGKVAGGSGSHKGVEGWYDTDHYGYLGGNNRGAEAYYDASHWAYFASSSRAGYFVGDVHVSGTLSKSAGSFKIDHPLDPENKYLSHSFVESPDMKNIYDGVVTLNASGEASVQLPEWFGVLNIDFRYQLTAIGAPGPNLYIAQEISNNEFKIAGGAPGMKVSWQVTGIRNDEYAQKHRIQVEEDKNDEERGKYLHPDLYGYTEDMREVAPVKSEAPTNIEGPESINNDNEEE